MAWLWIHVTFRSLWFTIKQEEKVS